MLTWGGAAEFGEVIGHEFHIVLTAVEEYLQLTKASVKGKTSSTNFGT